MRSLVLSALIVLAAGPAVARQEPPAAIDAAYRRALETPATRAAVERLQADYLRERAAAGDGAEGIDEAQGARLAFFTAAARRAGAATTTAAALADACVPVGLERCGSAMGGYLNGPDDARLYWQLQDGATDEDGITQGIVFFAGDETLRPVAWAYPGARISPPIVVQGEDGLYVAVPGRTFGMGRGEAETLFRWEQASDTPLIQVDSWSWRDDLARLLPPGLNAYGRIVIDYEEMIATAPLWRETDPGCCDTGGYAIVSFEISDGRLKATEARVVD
jgi:hypothetical protein